MLSLLLLFSSLSFHTGVVMVCLIMAGRLKNRSVVVRDREENIGELQRGGMHSWKKLPR